ncbi:SDR family NAD(P)-dependent oxidoreductase, partial [Rhizobium leguminosarum bv. viciae]
MLIRGASFIVTGGGSGLGAATVHMLVEAGGRVTIADLNAEAGQEIVREFGSDARFVKADVTDGEEGAGAVAAAIEAFGGLRGLVNCAGVAPAEKVIGRDGPHRLESFARTVSINLIGTFN